MCFSWISESKPKKVILFPYTSLGNIRLHISCVVPGRTEATGFYLDAKARPASWYYTPQQIWFALKGTVLGGEGG